MALKLRIAALALLAPACAPPQIVREYADLCQSYGGPDDAVVSSSNEASVLDLTSAARNAATLDSWHFLTASVYADGRADVLTAAWIWPGLEVTEATLGATNDSASEWAYQSPQSGLEYQVKVAAEWRGDETEAFRVIECWLSLGTVEFD